MVVVSVVVVRKLKYNTGGINDKSKTNSRVIIFELIVGLIVWVTAELNIGINGNINSKTNSRVIILELIVGLIVWLTAESNAGINDKYQILELMIRLMVRLTVE